ncbi:MAG: hypothetical protein F6K47_30635 [Symploca sp. SIO2E6]|nr:hypothetical protein [Symploca sp. SIO2E6]
MNHKEIAALGASLRQIDRKLLTPTTQHDNTRIWYQGGEPYFDLFVELRQGKIDWFQFTLRGKSLSWYSQFCSWQTGTTNELHTDDLTFHPASKLIESNGQLDGEFMELVRLILQTRAGEPFFDQILSLFDQH